MVDFESQKGMFSTPIHQREMSKSQEDASCPSTSSTNTSEAQSICKLAPEVFSCASCKELLNRPIVLNCGEGSIKNDFHVLNDFCKLVFMFSTSHQI